MKRHISSIRYQILENGFVYRGWDVRGDHMPEEKSPKIIRFGETMIMLRLINGKPRLDVPEGQCAKLLESDCGYVDGLHVEGKFVEVRIY